MRKEIFEQPRAVADSLLGRRTPEGLLHLDEMRLSDDELRDIDKIIIIACGTSFYAGMVAKYAIEHWTRTPVEVELASEFRYRDPILDYSTLVVAISQSGETADTLQAIRHARTQRSKVLAICNTNGSTIPRESDAVIYTHAGPEIGVASTKGFLTQLVACYLLALYLAQIKGTRYGDEIGQIVRQLEEMPAHIETVLERAEQVYELARAHLDTKSVLFLGRHAGYPVALEGALKLKELAYLHAEGFAAGELKHGPIALIEPGLPVLCVVPPQGRDQLHDKMISGIQEVRARGAQHDLPGRGGRHLDRAVRRRPDPAAAGAGAAAAAGGDRAAAAVRVRAGHGARPRRRPAAQPGQVRHRRVSAAMHRRRRHRRGRHRAVRRVDRAHAVAGGAAVHAGRGGAARWPRWPPASRPRRRSPRPSARPYGMHWHDAEVVSEESGRPVLTIRGTVLARADELGVVHVHLSLVPRRRHRLGRRGAGVLTGVVHSSLASRGASAQIGLIGPSTKKTGD